MSIASFFSNIFGPTVLTTSKAIAAAPATAITAVQTFGASETLKIVAALKETSIGTAVANDVSALTNSELSGAEKFAQVLTNTVPLVLELLSGGGVAAVEADVEGIARSLVQMIYTDVADTGFGKIAGGFLKLLGV